jgi:putative membrane protein
MKIINFLLFLTVLAIGFIFTMLNSASVELNYYYGLIELPLALVAMAALLIGVLLGLFVEFGKHIRLKSELARAKRKLKKSDEELDRLRVLAPRKN